MRASLRCFASSPRTSRFSPRTDGPQALAAAERFPATTALLDIGLPVMDGYELARRLRERWTDRPVRFVAITGYGQETDKEKAKAVGFDAHLVKPVDVAALAALLQGGCRNES